MYAIRQRASSRLMPRVAWPCTAPMITAFTTSWYLYSFQFSRGAYRPVKAHSGSQALAQSGRSSFRASGPESKKHAAHRAARAVLAGPKILTARATPATSAAWTAAGLVPARRHHCRCRQTRACDSARQYRLAWPRKSGQQLYRCRQQQQQRSTGVSYRTWNEAAIVGNHSKREDRAYTSVQQGANFK